MEFQHRLYDLRKKAGLSQEELAGLLHVTRQAVQKWEAGTSRPDMERSGMGFTVMETFMDAVSVRSRLGHGTTVRMEKQLGREIPREKEP